jgi:hypothetical protein
MVTMVARVRRRLFLIGAQFAGEHGADTTAAADPRPSFSKNCRLFICSSFPGLDE